MMDNFETAEFQTDETSIFARWSGSGSPILLLHGFPQTHLMWRTVAPMLARNFTVVCADLRGYGRSGCLASTPDHAPYAKRAMAKDFGQDLEALDDARPRTVEVRGPVHRVDVSCPRRTEAQPLVRKRDPGEFLAGALECEAARHEDDDRGIVGGDATPGDLG